ncbi:MAG: hypothetical protein LBJ62_03550 [Bifidobacteriaceae bacterium]|nr:hypothetical protein [Bifidobacteriaceae bacterium]
MSSRPWLCALLIAGLAGLAGSACVDGAAPGGDAPETPPEVTAAALVDRETVTITLPLQRYAMTWEEEKVVLAAQQIVFAQCVTGLADPPPSALDAAIRTLALEASPNPWLYGFWSAEFVAENGYVPLFSEVTLGDGLDVTSEQGSACVASPEYMALDLIDPTYLTQSREGDLLGQLVGETMAQTVTDDRFVTLAKARRDCITESGYQADPDSELMSVVIKDEWNYEQKLQAAIVEAQCSDGLDLVQQAANLNATYEQLAIDRNQAELVAIRQIAVSRAEKARQILIDYGVM